jgi:SAM-dependent methyltransferase
VTHQSQEAYWRKVCYRDPQDPVVRAYVLPKLELVESVLPLFGRTILDVGCGPGVFTYYLKKRCARVVGTDCSADMLGRIVDIETVQADARRLPFDDASFDIAFEANLLHHTNDPQRVVSEMARISREAVVLIEPNRLNPLMFGFSLLVAAEHGGLRFSRGFLDQLIVQAGLHPKKIWTTGMISQNNTPRFLVPFLKIFDRDLFFGEYHVAVSTKPSRDPTS